MAWETERGSCAPRERFLCPDQGSEEQQGGFQCGWEEGGEGAGKVGHRSPGAGLHPASGKLRKWKQQEEQGRGDEGDRMEG